MIHKAGTPLLDPLARRFLDTIEIQAERPGVVSAVAFLESKRPHPARPEKLASGSTEPHRQALVEKWPRL